MYARSVYYPIGDNGPCEWGEFVHLGRSPSPTPYTFTISNYCLYISFIIIIMFREMITRKIGEIINNVYIIIIVHGGIFTPFYTGTIMHVRVLQAALVELRLHCVG